MFEAKLSNIHDTPNNKNGGPLSPGIGADDEEKISGLHPQENCFILNPQITYQNISSPEKSPTKSTKNVYTGSSILKKPTAVMPSSEVTDSEALGFLRNAVTTKSIYSISADHVAKARIRNLQKENSKSQRITPDILEIHPSLTRKIVCVGDSQGRVSIWQADHTNLFGAQERPVISKFNLHKDKRVSAIHVHPSTDTKLYSAGGDGQILRLDLAKGIREESPILSLNDKLSAPKTFLSITDMNLAQSDPNLIYFSTYGGTLGLVDLRQENAGKPSLFVQLSDSPLIKFALNPSQHNQVATISVDRTLRIWDLRYLSPYETDSPPSSESDDSSDSDDSDDSDSSDSNDDSDDSDSSGNRKAPLKSTVTAHLYGLYEDRPFSPNSSSSFQTAVDWNSQGRLLLSNINTSDKDCSPDGVLIFDHAIKDAAQTWNHSIVFGKPFKYSSSIVFDRSPINIPLSSSTTYGRQMSTYLKHYQHSFYTEWQKLPLDGIQKFAIVTPKTEKSPKNSISIYDGNANILRTIDVTSGPNDLKFVKMHPRLNWIAGLGSDRAAYVWE